MEQERRYHGGGDDGDFEDENAAPVGQERLGKLASETDDILDDINDILEENAEEFVNSYVQKGGQ